MPQQIDIRGVIVPDSDYWIYEWFDIAATAPKVVRDVLQAANGDDVEVLINSTGGDVFAGSEIFTILRSYAGKVTVKIQSIAASAAAVIAMAGESEMSPVAQLMIHNVSASAGGDYRDMEHTAEVLKSANKAIAAAFVAKTGRSEAEILDLMDKETWFTAERAVQGGFVDRIMFNSQTVGTAPLQLAASHGSGLLPLNVLDYARKNFINQTAEVKAKAEYEFLLLEGKSK